MKHRAVDGCPSRVPILPIGRTTMLCGMDCKPIPAYCTIYGMAYEINPSPELIFRIRCTWGRYARKSSLKARVRSCRTEVHRAACFVWESEDSAEQFKYHFFCYYSTIPAMRQIFLLVYALLSSSVSHRMQSVVAADCCTWAAGLCRPARCVMESNRAGRRRSGTDPSRS